MVSLATESVGATISKRWVWASPSNQCENLKGPFSVSTSLTPGPVRYRLPAAQAGMDPVTLSSMGPRCSSRLAN